MATMTYADFLKTIKPGMLNANGGFLGPNSGVNYQFEGKTPEQVYDQTVAQYARPVMGTPGLNYGDGVPAPVMPIDQALDPSWQAGPQSSGGLWGMATNPSALKAYASFLAAAFGGQALMGAGGATAGAGEGIGSSAGWNPAMDSQAANVGSGATNLGLSGGDQIAALQNSQVAALSPGAAAPGTMGSGTYDIGASIPTVPTTGLGATGATLSTPGTMGSGSWSLGSSIPDLGASSAVVPGVGTAGNLIGTGGGATNAAGDLIGDGTATAGAATGAGASGATGPLDSVNQWISDNPLLAKTLGLVSGAALGAAAGQGGQTTQTQNKDPWGPAQPYLLNNLATNANMQANYLANPFSDVQKQQYQGLLNTLANNQQVGNGLLSNAGNFMNSKHGVMPTMQAMPTGTQAAPIDWTQYQNMGVKK